MLRAILPHKWHDIDLPLEGQESYVVYFNNNKSVSMLRLRENVEHVYGSKVLPLLGLLQPEEIPADQQQFEDECLRRLLIFSPNSSLEFAVALRSLPTIIREHRPLGLVVVDSLNTFSMFDYDLHKEVEQSSVVVDPKATSFVIQNKGLNTKKRKGRSFEPAVLAKCSEMIKDYWEEDKFPLIVTRVDNTSLSSVENLGRPRNKDIADLSLRENSGSMAAAVPEEKKDDGLVHPDVYPLIDLSLKKIETDQILVVADRQSRLYEQICGYAGFKRDRGGVLLISKASEELEYDVTVVMPKENTLYAELETLDQKRVKIAS